MSKFELICEAIFAFLILWGGVYLINFAMYLDQYHAM